MSGDNFETGRMKLIFDPTTSEESLDDFLKGLCVKHGVTEKEDNYSWTEMFREEVAHDEKYKPRYLLLNDRVFEVLEYQNHDEHYHTTVRNEGNGEYSFSSSYHSGGTYLEETLEEEMVKMK